MKDLKQYDDTSRVGWQHCSLQQTEEVAKKLRTEEYPIDDVRLLRFATLSKSLTASSSSSMPGIGVNKFALTELDNPDSHFEINFTLTAPSRLDPSAYAEVDGGDDWRTFSRSLDVL